MTSHTIRATTIGAGTGNTYYRLECACKWRHDDYNPMHAHDLAIAHQKESR